MPLPTDINAGETTGHAADHEVINAAINTLVANFQGLDSDLSALAALTTTEYGRALLELANAAALRTAAGLGTAAVEDADAFDTAGAAAAAQAAAEATAEAYTDAEVAALSDTYVGVSDAPYAPPPGLNEWVHPGAATLATFAFSNGELRVGPVWLHPGTYDALGWEVTTGGASGSVTRAFVFADNGSGKPGATSVLDSAQVASTVAAVKTVTGLSLVVPTFGLYWVGVVNQGGGGTEATLRYVATGGGQGNADTAIVNPRTTFGWVATGVTGAAAALTWSRDQNNPRVVIRRSA